MTQRTKETWCLLSIVLCLAWLKLGVQWGKVEVDETSEIQIMNGLTCHLEDVG